MAQKQFKSLQQKLLLSVLSVSLILAVGAATISFIEEFERSKSQTEIMLNQLLDTVEGTAAIAAFSNNAQIAQDVVNGLLKNDIVFRVRIKSDGGFIFEQAKNEAESGKKLNEKEIERPLYSPFGDGQLLGSILVQPTAKFNLNEAQHSAEINALSSIALIGVTAVIILLLVRSNISKPLSIVSNTLHAIKSGEKQRLPILRKNTNDELGRLVLDINNLLDVLESQFNEEHSLRQQIESIEQQLRDIFNSSSAGLFLLDKYGNIRTLNATLKKILHANHIDDATLTHNYPIASFFNEQTQFIALLQSALRSGRLETKDFSLQNTSGPETVWLHCLVSKVIDSSGKVGIEGVLFDVTQRVENELAIKHAADHDPLTGLLRRQAAQAAFARYMTSNKSPSLSILLMDLDGFKKANDTYGHLVGDKVLAIAAERLLQSVRTTDIVARLGGDEFLIILINHPPPVDRFETAEKIVMSIQHPMSIDDDTIVKVGISLGIANMTHVHQDFEYLVKAADEAMYEVKRKGKNGYCIYGSDMRVKLYRPDAASPTQPEHWI